MTDREERRMMETALSKISYCGSVEEARRLACEAMNTLNDNAFGPEFVEEVRTELAQQDYVREWEESA